MEQKKLLWIISGVGLFLLVIFLTAMIIYKPSSTSATPIPVETVTTTTTTTTTTDSGWKPVEEPKVDTPVETIEPSTDSDLTVTAQPVENTESVNVSDLFQSSDEQTAPVTTIDLNELKNQLNKDSQPQNINITVNIPEAEVTATTSSPAVVTTKTEKVPATTTVETTSKATTTTTKVDAATAEKAEKEASVNKTTASTSTKTTSGTKTTATSTKTDTTSTASKPAATTSTTKPAATSTKTAATTTTTAPVTRYWVQVASLSTKKAAENARDVLAENKIDADVFTHEDSQGIHYRVRVGPYTSNTEAEYWKNNILKIKYFEKSGAYVTKTIN